MIKTLFHFFCAFILTLIAFLQTNAQAITPVNVLDLCGSQKDTRQFLAEIARQNNGTEGVKKWLENTLKLPKLSNTADFSVTQPPVKICEENFEQIFSGIFYVELSQMINGSKQSLAEWGRTPMDGVLKDGEFLFIYIFPEGANDPQGFRLTLKYYKTWFPESTRNDTTARQFFKKYGWTIQQKKAEETFELTEAKLSGLPYNLYQSASERAGLKFSNQIGKKVRIETFELQERSTQGNSILASILIDVKTQKIIGAWIGCGPDSSIAPGISTITTWVKKVDW